jgi:hypothetical protein
MEFKLDEANGSAASLSLRVFDGSQRYKDANPGNGEVVWPVTRCV